ncbi:MAG: hypothetical protein F6K39_32820 [Okeania sp. SIO3B3]|nr:hypothetical protein [Okeania sp. SIO3B3]
MKGEFIKPVDGRIESLPAPENFEITSVTYKSVSLKWDAVDGAVSYNIYRDSYSPTIGDLIASGITGTTYTDEELTTLSRYTYHVRAVRASDEVSYNRAEKSATIPDIPEPDLTIENLPNDGGLKLSWADDYDPDLTYSIYKKTYSGTFYSSSSPEESNITESYWIDDSTNAGEHYYYGIRAFLGDKKSDDIHAVYGWHMDEPDDAVARLKGEEIEITWGDNYTVPEGIEARVERSADGGAFETLGTVAGKDESYTDDTIDFGVAYAYRLTLVDGEVEKTHTCDEVTFDGKVTGVKASDGSSGYGEIVVTWDALTLADSYAVYESTMEVGGYSLIDTVTDNEYVRTGLNRAQRRYYKVKAIDNDGPEMPLSEAACGEAWGRAIAEPDVDISNKIARVEWEGQQGTDYYVVVWLVQGDSDYFYYSEDKIYGTSVNLLMSSFVGDFLDFWVMGYQTVDGGDDHYSEAGIRSTYNFVSSF